MATKHIQRFDRESGIHALVMVVGLSVALPIIYAHPGPDWLWMTDMCPSKSVVCGTMPIGPLGAVIVGAVVAVATLGVIHRGE